MIRVTLTLLALSSVLPAQTWTQLNPTSAPSARSGHAMAYDAARQRVVLFGGFRNQMNSETWTWDGKNWTKMNPSVSPPARTHHSMAYDSSRKQVVLFGGNGGGSLSDTWLWNGTTWKKANVVSHPSARYSHAMAYDTKNSQVVLFGGHSGSQKYGDTWVWNGTTWIPRLLTSTSPAARYEHAMTYDSVRKQVVLFGGYAGYSQRDTWQWDGNKWSLLLLASSPKQRSLHAVAFDMASGKTVLFGGYFAGNLGDTWVFDGSNWGQVHTTSTPTSRTEHAMAYDEKNQQVVLFGGSTSTGPNAETWILGRTVAAKFTTFGTGCGPTSAVTLAAAPNSSPLLGSSFKLDTANAPLSSSAAVLAAGTSKSTFGPLALPIVLDPFGLPGCKLYQNLTWSWLFTLSQGSGQFILPIPNDKGLLGANLHVQSFVVAPKVNAASLLTSNGGTMLIGNQ